jgi:hypothetical protein
MDKQNIIFLILFIIIASTLINVLVLGNKKITDNPKLRKFFRISLITGVVVFSLTLIIYLSLI